MLWTGPIPFARLVKFLAVGFPAFLLAVPANYFLVEHANVPKSLSYAMVLLGQISLNYFMCRRFVFQRETAKNPSLLEYYRFIGGIAAIRCADWVLYNVIVALGVYFVWVQLLNVFVFSIMKYHYSRWVLSAP